MSEQDQMIDELSLSYGGMSNELNTLWLIIGAVLVFLMQAGFAMLEVGSVDSKNTQNILLKNGEHENFTLHPFMATNSLPHIVTIASQSSMQPSAA